MLEKIESKNDTEIFPDMLAIRAKLTRMFAGKITPAKINNKKLD